MKQICMFLIFISSLFSYFRFSSAYAQPDRKVFRYTISQDIHQYPDAESIVLSALSLVEAVAPPNFILVPASGRDIRERVDFTVQVTNSSYIRADFPQEISNRALDTNATAYTLSFHGHLRNRLMIVRLIWDRLVYERVEGRLVPRPDAFTRVVAALAHEIYGNVRAYSSNRVNRLSRTDMEVAAFTSGIKTLEQVADLMEGRDISDKIRGDIQLAILRERAGLRSWMRTQSRQCESVFEAAEN